MGKTMAEVLERHGEWRYTNGAGSPIVCRECGAPVDSVTEHQAAALAAAGFGLVADAKREAWDEAVNEADRQWQIGHASAAILKQDNPYRKASNDDQ